MKTYIVLGTSYGDEGKGLVVDHLARQVQTEPIIVRFNGGPQAEHTVNRKGMSHRFQHFGAGSLNGAPTFWSRYCPVDLVALMEEHKALIEVGLSPIVFFDPHCPIITPYDIKDSRKNHYYNGHGTTGRGYGSTLEREKNHYHFHIFDLSASILKHKYRLVSEYYASDLISDASLRTHLMSYKDETNIVLMNKKFYEAVDYFQSNWESFIVSHKSIINDFSVKIFEGAQGLMLDKRIGFFPYVTRGDVTMGNALAMINDLDTVEVCYVTRTYTTRHGNGPMPLGEDLSMAQKIKPYQTIDTTIGAGNLRIGPLDISSINRAVDANCSLNDLKHPKIKGKIFVTWQNVLPLKVLEETALRKLSKHLGDEARLTFLDKFGN